MTPAQLSALYFRLDEIKVALWKLDDLMSSVPDIRLEGTTYRVLDEVRKRCDLIEKMDARRKEAVNG